MSGAYRQALKSIEPNTQNSLVVGIIIASLNSKTFESNPSRSKFYLPLMFFYFNKDTFSDAIGLSTKIRCLRFSSEDICLTNEKMYRSRRHASGVDLHASRLGA